MQINKKIKIIALIVIVFSLAFIFPFSSKEFNYSGGVVSSTVKYGLLGIIKMEKTFSRNGMVNSIEPKLFGKLNGNLIIYYNESDQIKFSIRYCYGKIVKVNEMFDKKGNALDFGNVQKGNGILRVYTSKGKIESYGNVVD